MGHAVCSDLAFVGNGGNIGCGCNPTCTPGCSATVFRSVWDRLCQQLFGAIPPGMDTEDILPDITIWDKGVVLVADENGNYDFTINSVSGTPKAGDVILYKGKFYIIGEVE